MSLMKHGPGRPMKYGRASRVVTLTLPEDVITRLRTVNSDLGRAVVGLAERHPHRRVTRQAEISAYGNHAVIVVHPARALKRLPGVELVPIGDGRALIALEGDISVSQLELEIRDVVDRGEVRGEEKATLDAIADILRRARLSRSVSLKQRTIIVLEAKRQRRRA
jgi:hypothetical protein